MEKEILENLISKKLTLKEITKELNTSQTNIRYWIKKYQLRLFRSRGGKLPYPIYKCKCGETNPKKFYGKKCYICSKCHNQYTIKSGQEKREKARQVLGGKCISCGFDKYPCSLDIHHLDPSKKDKDFIQMRGWSWEKIEKEIKNCVLLCKNCHAAYHNNLLKI